MADVPLRLPRSLRKQRTFRERIDLEQEILQMSYNQPTTYSAGKNDVFMLFNCQ